MYGHVTTIILELTIFRNICLLKLLNADVTWTQQLDQKSVEPIQKHVNKCEQRIIPEHNAIILLKLRHEWHVQLYNFYPEGTIEEEDDSNCFEESRIVEETLRRTGNTDWCLSFCVNSVNRWISRRNIFVTILCKILTVF